MKEKIIGIILAIGLGVYLVNMTSWGEIKYRQAKDSILHSKECKIVDKSIKTEYFSSEDYECKNDRYKYDIDVAKYDRECVASIPSNIANIYVAINRCRDIAESAVKRDQELRCDDEFSDFNNGEKVLLKANTNCNTDTFFHSVVTANGEIVSRELVMTNDGKIKEFVNLGKSIYNYGTYDVHFFHSR